MINSENFFLFLSILNYFRVLVILNSLRLTTVKRSDDRKTIMILEKRIIRRAKAKGIKIVARVTAQSRRLKRRSKVKKTLKKLSVINQQRSHRKSWNLPRMLQMLVRSLISKLIIRRSHQQ